MKHALLAATFALAFSLPALAHGHLDSAEPADGASLTAAPEAISLGFTEDLELALSSITLTDAAGSEIPTGPAAHEGGAANTLRVELPSLAPGAYTVSWQITSVDTHATEGSYSFTLN